MNGRHRTSIALTAAALLTGAGAAVVANGAPTPHPVDVTEPGPVAYPAPQPRTVELERSVSDLLAQVSELEAAMASSALPAPSAPATSTRAPAAPSGATSGSAATRAPASTIVTTTDDPAPTSPAATAAAIRSEPAPQSKPTEDEHAAEPREDSHEDRNGGDDE